MLPRAPGPGPPPAVPGADASPRLDFAVEDASAVEFAAVPTLRLGLRIDSPGGEDIRALVLGVQVRVAVDRRRHDAATRARLVELFGAPEGWGAAARSLLWTQATLTVPAFRHRTHADLLVACTYDFEVTTAKYFHALAEGEIPLELLFSGSVFFTGASGGLTTTRVPWDREAAFRLPVRVWSGVMERHFPGSAWLRLDRATFDRLYAWKAQRALPSWEAALEALLDGRCGDAPGERRP